uniref:hypothetical protein n=1 Tax=Ruegeria arenilitoris TaxID=1173585 RepID=UPI00147D8A1C|nr:hypothetical protein [Ruegeria arenilitoris]
MNTQNTDQNDPCGLPSGAFEKQLAENQLRVEQAKALSKKLEQESKVQPSQRPLFAQNLGKMFHVAKKRGGLTLKDYFEIAFGAHWESYYKKRKRFVLLEGELASEDTFNAEGRKYLRLAQAMSRTRGDQTRQIAESRNLFAVLPLVQGTYLDNTRAASIRHSTVQEEHLLTLFEKFVSVMVSSINLDDYRQSITSSNLGVPPEWPRSGELSLISGAGWGQIFDMDADYVFDAPFQRLAPTVAICDIGTPAAKHPYCVVKVPKRRVDRLGLDAAVEFSIYDLFGLTDRLSIGEDDFEDGGNWALFNELYEEHHWDWYAEFRDIARKRPDLSKALEAVNFKLETVLRLSLQLRFDASFQVWKPAFVLRLADDPGTWNYEMNETRIQPDPSIFGDLSGKVELPGNMAPFRDLKRFETAEDYIFIVAWPKWNGVKDDLFQAIANNEVERLSGENDLFASVNGVNFGTMLVPGREAVNFLLEPVESARYSIDYLIDIPERQFTPFPVGSVAEALCLNLRCAQKEERLDMLLAKDAQLRISNVDEFLGQLRSEYDKWVAGFPHAPE